MGSSRVVQVPRRRISAQWSLVPARICWWVCNGTALPSSLRCQSILQRAGGRPRPFCGSATKSTGRLLEESPDYREHSIALSRCEAVYPVRQVF